MKNFEEFRESLTSDILDDIDIKALEYRDKCLDERFGKDDIEGRFAVHQRFYNECFCLSMLERYHQWLQN